MVIMGRITEGESPSLTPERVRRTAPRLLSGTGSRAKRTEHGVGWVGNTTKNTFLGKMKRKRTTERMSRAKAAIGMASRQEGGERVQRCPREKWCDLAAGKSCVR